MAKAVFIMSNGSKNEMIDDRFTKDQYTSYMMEKFTNDKKFIVALSEKSENVVLNVNEIFSIVFSEN